MQRTLFIRRSPRLEGGKEPGRGRIVLSAIATRMAKGSSYHSRYARSKTDPLRRSRDSAHREVDRRRARLQPAQVRHAEGARGAGPEARRAAEGSLRGAFGSRAPRGLRQVAGGDPAP